MNKIITSALGKLNLRDLAHGLLMAALGAVTGTIYQWVDALQATGHFAPLDYHQILTGATIASIAYLAKQLGTPAQVISTLPSK